MILRNKTSGLISVLLEGTRVRGFPLQGGIIYHDFRQAVHLSSYQQLVHIEELL